MYLTGRKYHWQSWDNPDQDRKEDGLPVENVSVRLGYWRKHPNLHGFIVNEFAEGEDEQQNIALSADNIRAIIDAVKHGALPETSGFFFGKSDGSEKDEDIKILENALKWLEGGDVAPVSLGEPIAIGAGFAAFEVKPDRTEAQLTELGIKQKPKGQRVSRDVIYHSSW
jgi:hypothetical protein